MITFIFASIWVALASIWGLIWLLIGLSHKLLVWFLKYTFGLLTKGITQLSVFFGKDKSRISFYLFKCATKGEDPKKVATGRAARRQFEADPLTIKNLIGAASDAAKEEELKELDSKKKWISNPNNNSPNQYWKISSSFVVEYINESLIHRFYAAFLAIRFYHLWNMQWFEWTAQSFEDAKCLWGLEILQIHYLFAFLVKKRIGVISVNNASSVSLKITSSEPKMTRRRRVRLFWSYIVGS